MTEQKKTFRLTLNSDPKQISRVEAFLTEINEQVHLNEIQMHKLMVSVTEAANNAIIHGNKMDPGKKANVTCEIRDPWLIFVVTDEGDGFDPEEVRSPLEEENLLKTSGRGIFLMRTLMDRVDYVVGKDGVRLELWLNTSR